MNDQLKQIDKSLKNELDKDRYIHTIGVMHTAACLAMNYSYDMNKAMLAGLLHDCAKSIPNDMKIKLCKKNKIELSEVEEKNPSLIHAKLGAFIAKNTYKVTDEEILHSIQVHTTGAPAMNLLDKIVYVADYIEPNRYKQKNLSAIRTLAFQDIDRAVLQILEDTIGYINNSKEKKEIDPISLATYSYYKEALQ